MASPKNHRRGHEEKNRRGRLAEKSSSFHGRSPSETTSQLRRPKTVSDLLPSRSAVVTTSLEQQRPMKLTKLLLNVTVQGSVGAVQVLMTPESTVGDLVAAALCQYFKEGRRPILPTVEPSRFNLHYSQFSLECKFLFCRVKLRKQIGVVDSISFCFIDFTLITTFNFQL